MNRIAFFILLLVMPVLSKAQMKMGSKTNKDSLLKVVESGKDDTGKVNAYLALNRYFRLKNAPKSFEYARDARALASKLNFDKGVAKAENSIAVYYKSQDQNDSMFAHYDSAMVYALRADDHFQTGLEHLNIGQSYMEMGSVDDALKHFVLADSIGEQINDKYLIEASLDALSGIYYHEKNYKLAIEYINRLIAYGKKSNDIYTLAAEYGNLGNIKSAMGEKKEALGWYFLAVKCYGEEGAIQLPQQYANIGQTYYDLGKYDSCLYYSRIGLSYRSQQNSSIEIARCYQNIGGSLLHMEKADSALWYVNTALSMAMQGNAMDMILSCHELLTEIYELKGDYVNALAHSKEYSRLTDSVNTAADAELRNEMLARFDSRKKEEVLALQQKDIQSLNEQRHKDRIILWIVAVSALLVLVLIFAAYQIKRKANVKLAEQNEEITLQKDEIATKNKEITDSINYAKRIQDAALPDLEILRSVCKGYFIVNRPRNIVSGDFYWFSKQGTRTYVAVADCTGHGVPGALVSVIGIGLLSQIVENDPKISTGNLLNRLHHDMIRALNKNINQRDTNDGMDIAITCIDDSAKTIEYSGAVRPLYFVSGNELKVIKGDRHSIGGEAAHDAVDFATNKLERARTEMLYMFSDGYADQFGSDKGKKFLIKRFHEMLGRISGKSTETQKETLETEFDRWKGSLEQVDDVLVMGIKL